MLSVPSLLDGAMGTALLARGLGPGAIPEEWVIARPAEVARVHAAHAAAGARVLLTCTFNVAGPRLAARLDPARTEEICAAAVHLARDAARGPLVAGDLGPTGLVRPGSPDADPAALRAAYQRPARGLAAAGVDLLWIESQWVLAEARAALAAARETGLPVAVTFGFREERGRLVAGDGMHAEECLAAVAAEGAALAGVNCVFPDAALAALAAWAREGLHVPFVAKPSPGLPGAVLPPDAFAAAMLPALNAGLRIAGACCGGDAGHLRALGAALASSA